MWIERLPEEGETVKVEFSKWTNLGIQIGVFLRRSINGHYITDFGRTLRYLDKDTTFFVWTK